MYREGLAPWERGSDPAHHSACPLCGRVHNEEENATQFVCGWSCTRVQRHVAQARHRRPSRGNHARGVQSLRNTARFLRRPLEPRGFYLRRLLSYRRQVVALGRFLTREALSGPWTTDLSAQPSTEAEREAVLRFANAAYGPSRGARAFHDCCNGRVPEDETWPGALSLGAARPRADARARGSTLARKKYVVCPVRVPWHPGVSRHIPPAYFAWPRYLRSPYVASGLKLRTPDRRPGRGSERPAALYSSVRYRRLPTRFAAVLERRGVPCFSLNAASVSAGLHPAPIDGR